jgi:hypothetical protein
MEDNDSQDFSDDWQEDDQQTEYAEYTGISPDELYEVLLSQQQQLQDIGLVLQQMMEVMQQVHNPPPDYQPLLYKLVSGFVEMRQQNQKLQSSIGQQTEVLSIIKSEVGNAHKRLGEVVKKTNAQAKTLTDYLGWSATLRYGALGLLTGISVLISSQLLSSLANSSLEKKIDNLNERVEKVLKKGR